MEGEKILKNVKQIGLEIHTTSQSVKDLKESVYKHMIYNARKMYQEFGFSLINYTPNGCFGKKVKNGYRSKYFALFEVVFYKL